MTEVPLLTVDFETRSKVSIKDLGGRIYAQHPTTEVVCASSAWMEDGRISTHAVAPATPGWDVPWPWDDVGVFDALAHNHRFDARVWERLGWPAPRRWVDTTELSRRAGMPLAKLEYLAQELLGESKDMEGNALTKSLSRLVSRGARKGEYSLDPIPADVLARVVEYCIKDSVLALRLYYEHFQPWDHVSDFEDAVLEFDRVVNNRGVGFDVALARALQHVDDRLAADALAAAGLQDPKAVSSNDRFRAGMAALGVHIDNAQKATVLPLLEHPDERVRLLAAARLGGNTIAGGKLAAALATVSADARLRDLYVFRKAHTGRWAGVGFQPQNLPK